MTHRTQGRTASGIAGLILAVLLFCLSPLAHAQVSTTAGGSSVPLWGVLVFVGGPVLAVVLGIQVWMVKGVRDHTMEIRTFRTVLFGEQGGDRGLLQNFQRMRDWRHDEVTQWQQEVTTNVELLTQQMEDVHQRLKQMEESRLGSGG